MKASWGRVEICCAITRFAFERFDCIANLLGHCACPSLDTLCKVMFGCAWEGRMVANLIWLSCTCTFVNSLVHVAPLSSGLGSSVTIETVLGIALAREMDLQAGSCP